MDRQSLNRSRTLNVRVTPAERQIAAKLAEHLGCRESVMLRSLLVQEARAHGLLPPPKEDRPTAHAAV